ncbi:MAG: UDP-N-acetylglucosamine 1-carboxyvinyltransferase [Clostridia bacterium]|nr:UDP-N-acetylglucosamine 1-carboxyvinyltransferase [Clostridia bacterium]MCR5693580.1 UDP-N-acetylglucosamine 1-carboxyvinyltransferase [Clostridia bacterium]
MKKLVIHGGKPLHGEVNISGSKNAAVGIIAATILANGICKLENVPDVSDIKILLEALTYLGASYERSGDLVVIDTTGVDKYIADKDYIGKMRGSSYLMGALLGRFHNAQVYLPGGCNLGPRPIDQHLKGFTSLGASTSVEMGKVEITAKDGLVGNNVYLDIVSVGATINIMLAACTAEGNTIIENCAMEPHVVDVANFLNTCGANIRGAGTNTIRIKGVKHLHGCIYSIIPDQIEAGTFMVAAAATHGEVTVKNVIPKHQEALTAKLEEMNIGIKEGPDWITVYDKGTIRSTNVQTAPYPGFPTDMQPQIVTLLACAEGQSKVTESIWNSRFSYTSELNRMGANITIQDKIATVVGCRSLAGISMKAPDLRAGAAFVIAALAAEGVSTIYGTHYIDRGYDNFEGKLSALGADIYREEAVFEDI